MRVKVDRIIVAFAIIASAVCALGQTNDPGVDIRTPNSANDAWVPNSSRIYESSLERKRQIAERLEIALLGENIDKLRVPQPYPEQFRSVLKDRRTKIASIYQLLDCHRSLTISVNQAEKCSDLPYISGNGSFYSFRLRTNVNERTFPGIDPDRADMQYSEGAMRVGGPKVQGLIAEVPTRTGSLIVDASLVARLKAHKIPSDHRGFNEQRREIQAGVDIGRHKFSNAVPVKVNSTYLLRSVAFRSFAVAQMFTKEDRDRILSKTDIGDLRRDIIVVFTVVGEEPDGSLILIWRTLSEKDAPVLKR